VTGHKSCVKITSSVARRTAARPCRSSALNRRRTAQGGRPSNVRT